MKTETIRCKQIPGLSNENALQILEFLRWVDAAPDWMDTDAVYESAVYAMEEFLADAQSDATPMQISEEDDEVFLWDDENGNTFAHTVEVPKKGERA